MEGAYFPRNIHGTPAVQAGQYGKHSHQYWACSGMCNAAKSP